MSGMLIEAAFLAEQAIEDIRTAEDRTPNSPESINGWVPPTIYDMQTGITRIATQADVDGLVRIARTYDLIRQRSAEADQHHRNMVEQTRRGFRLDPL